MTHDRPARPKSSICYATGLLSEGEGGRLSLGGLHGRGCMDLFGGPAVNTKKRKDQKMDKVFFPAANKCTWGGGTWEEGFVIGKRAVGCKRGQKEKKSTTPKNFERGTGNPAERGKTIWVQYWVEMRLGTSPKASRCKLPGSDRA